MARPESKRALGAFPLLPEWRQYIYRMFMPFSAKAGRAIAYDPYANEGDTILEIAKHLNLDPYGVEIQDHVFARGREKFKDFYADRGEDFSLTRYILDDSRNMRISNGSVGLLLCNPPYDDLIIDTSVSGMHRAQGIDGIRTERYEYTALKHNIQYVANGGYMIWIAYAQHMTHLVGEQFYRNFDGLFKFRFPDEHLGMYTQVCVIGRHIAGHRKSLDPVKMADRIKAFVEAGRNPELLPSADVFIEQFEQARTTESRYELTIPTFTNRRGKFMFVSSNKVDRETTTKLAARYGAHHLHAFKEAMAQPIPDAIATPLHRANKRQMIVFIAAGMLDGVVVMHRGSRVMLRGTVAHIKRQIDTASEWVTDKYGNPTERVKITSILGPEVSITLLYENGEVVEMKEQEELTELIKENGDLLIETFTERYKPFYDNTVHDVWMKILRQLHPGGLQDSNFTASQLRMIVCTVENMIINKRQITNAEMGLGKTAISACALVCMRILHLAIHHDRSFLPEIFYHFGLTWDDADSLLSYIQTRYGVKLSDLDTISLTDVTIVGVPPIAINVWMQQELPPLYPFFKLHELHVSSDANEFMNEAKANEDDRVIYVGVLSYERAKLNEGREPVAVQKNFRKYVERYNESTRRYENIMLNEIKPTDPITGAVVKDEKGDEVPWKRFTYEGRSKELYQFVGREFWGYDHIVEVDEFGKKRFVSDPKSPLYSVVVNRKLTQVEKDRNKSKGWPMYVSRQYVLYSEVRSPKTLPKIGNGVTITPEIEVTVPGKYVRSPRFKDGVLTHIETVWVNEYTVKKKDLDNQVLIDPDEVITDKWIASMGVRPLIGSGKNTVIQRLMRKHKLEEYRIGQGNKPLDKALTEAGINRYKYGVGEMVFRNPRYPVGDFLRRFYGNGEIAMFIADELHLAKNNLSEVSHAFRCIHHVARMTNGLTGTLYGGKSSTVYALGYEFNDWIARVYGFIRGTPMKWIERMGALKIVETFAKNRWGNTIRSGRKQSDMQVTETAGISPEIMKVFSPFTLWANLQDLGRGKMPEKTEEANMVEMTHEQAVRYQQTLDAVTDYNKKCLKNWDNSFNGKMYVTMLGLPDSMFRDETIVHERVIDKGAARKRFATKAPPVLVTQVHGMGPKPLPKEIEIAASMERDLNDGRRIIVVMSQTATRDIQPRVKEKLIEMLPKDLAKIFILSSSIEPKMRTEYIGKREVDGYNIMITNVRLITTAISLINWSAWYTVEYDSSLYNFSQGMARINRPNQKSPDIVYRHFHYNDKFQFRSVENIADKTKAAAVMMGVEGGGLSALMGSDERVQSFDGMLAAIESGRTDREASEAINKTFRDIKAITPSWNDSAWYEEGDEEFNSQSDMSHYVDSAGTVPDEKEEDGEVQLEFAFDEEAE